VASDPLQSLQFVDPLDRLKHLRELGTLKEDADKAHDTLLIWRKRLEQRATHNEPIAQKELDLYERANNMINVQYRSLAYELGISQEEIDRVLADLTLPDSVMGQHRQLGLMS
jgi:hypothetical protein